MKANGLILLSLLVSCSTASVTANVFNMPGGSTSLKMVPVGNPGNAPDTPYPIPPDQLGAVAYTYQMGKYEITASQYADFLNTVAQTDTYGLYNTSMDDDANPGGYGCNIKRSGVPGHYSYTVGQDWANRPVNYISWGDAARFVNWLHNGQPSGLQSLSTTESGAYYLNGATTDDQLINITRQTDARWTLPTEDEWYKAAYHKNDGITGNYWDYPMRSNAIPSNILGQIADPGNHATYRDFYGNGNRGYTIEAPYYRTEVGDHENSESPYGTYDQGGNVTEWTEAVWGTGRRILGGSWNYDITLLKAGSHPAFAPSIETLFTGFRVVAVPEPGSCLLLMFGAFTVTRRRW